MTALTGSGAGPQGDPLRIDGRLESGLPAARQLLQPTEACGLVGE
jgi:hypothetical protein